MSDLWSKIQNMVEPIADNESYAIADMCVATVAVEFSKTGVMPALSNMLPLLDRIRRMPKAHFAKAFGDIDYNTNAFRADFEVIQKEIFRFEYTSLVHTVHAREKVYFAAKRNTIAFGNSSDKQEKLMLAEINRLNDEIAKIKAAWSKLTDDDLKLIVELNVPNID